MFTTIPDLRPKSLEFCLIPVAIVFSLSDLVASQADVRYDPWDWVTYKNSSYISSITEGDDYIYFASNGGLLRYHIFGRYWDDPITRSQGLKNDNLQATYYDMNTHILWASSPSGLNYSMDGGRRWKLVTRAMLGLRPGEKIMAIGSTPDYLWCVTASQTIKLDHLSGYVITPYSVAPEENVKWGSSLLTEYSHSPSTLSEFVATGGWVNSLSGLQGPSFEEVAVSTIYVDRFGDIWVGTWGGPAFYGDIHTKQLAPIPFGPAQTSVTMFYKSENGLWLGGESQSVDQTGVTYVDIDRGIWEVYRFGYEIHFGSDQTLCGEKVGQELWFGTTNGILVYDIRSTSWTYLNEMKGLPNRRVTSLAYDGTNVYVGTPYGIARFSPKSGARIPWTVAETLRNERINRITWDGEDLWIASDRALFRWNAEGDMLRIYGSFGEEIVPFERETGKSGVGLLSPITAIVSSDSVVYFGDEFGILAYDRTRDSWERLTAKSRLVGFYFYALEISSLPDHRGTLLWLGTNKGAVMVDLKSDHVRRFMIRDGLPSAEVRAVAVDDNYAWFGTPKGLVRFRWRKYAE